MFANIVNTILPFVAGICLLIALLFALRAVGARAVVNKQAYDVGRQEARQTVQIALARSALALFVGLILFAVYGLSFRPANLMASPPVTDTPTVTATIMATATVTTTPTMTPSPQPASPEASPTNPLLVPTATATLTPTVTATPEPTTATVNSPVVGLFLREAPGGTQEVELLPDGTVLTLLDGRETVDGVVWQQVQAPSGNVGWVAADYIIYGNEEPAP